MLPRMDWNAEDKLAVWTFRERLEQYFMIASTPQAAKITHILFYGGRGIWEMDNLYGPSGRRQEDECRLFKAFANSFDKSSSHWQARDEYLADIKQAKHQTMAELDMYIKDLIRRCQFPQVEQESCKRDLYHSTVHFKVTKIVHNAKPEDLKYDNDWIGQGPGESLPRVPYTQASPLDGTPINYSNPLLQTSVFCQSPFRKAFPRRPVASVDAHTITVNALPTGSYAVTGKKNHWAQQCTSSTRQFVRMLNLPRKATEAETTKIQWQAVQQRQGMRRRRQ